MNAEEIIASLSIKFSPPEFVFLSQVRNGTGYARGTTRTADAIAIGTFPSRGLYIHGIEVKISRQDWLTELKNPQKAESIARFCDFWWIATDDEKIIKESELPPKWGLLKCNGKRNIAIKNAEINDLVVPLDRLILASILRNVRESHIPMSMFQTQLENKIKEELEYKTHKIQHELGDLKETIKRFEDDSGVKIGNRWSCENIGEAVKIVLAQKGIGTLKFNAIRLRDSAKEIIKVIDEALESKGEPK